MTATDDFALQKQGFSRIVHISDLGDTALIKDITATAPERAALIKQFHLDGLNHLQAHVSLRLLAKGDVRMSATLTAQLEQTCAVTLVPIKAEISIDFTLIYSQDAGEDWECDEDTLEDQDPPEPLIGEKIDIGEAVAEQFFLEIDPFPRVKGTVFDGFTTEREGEARISPEKKNPFAVLSQFKTKQKNTG